jgi:hypothetical protein
MRRAQSARAATYRCPFCGERLHAMSEHVLLAPEGDVDRRRHAHTECVLAERKAGRLPTEDEARRRTSLVFSRTQGKNGRGIFGRLWRR